jgi:ketol-acid reductoisomerase
LYEGLKKNASPTCQFGVSSSSQILAEETWADNFVEKQLARIQSGDFVDELQDQDRADEIRRQFFSTSIARSIRDAEQKSDAIFRKPQ